MLVKIGTGELLGDEVGVDTTDKTARVLAPLQKLIRDQRHHLEGNLIRYPRQ